MQAHSPPDTDQQPMPFCGTLQRRGRHTYHVGGVLDRQEAGGLHGSGLHHSGGHLRPFPPVKQATGAGFANSQKLHISENP